MAKILGIDLGTTNSCMAIIEGSDPKVIEAPRPAPHRLGENLTAFNVDGLKRFVAMLEASGRANFTLDEIKLTAGMILGFSESPPVKPLDEESPQ